MKPILSGARFRNACLGSSIHRACRCAVTRRKRGGLRATPWNADQKPSGVAYQTARPVKPGAVEDRVNPDDITFHAIINCEWEALTQAAVVSKNLGELFIVLLLKRFDLASKLAVGVHQASELYEGAHVRDIDFHRPSTAQHTRKHGDPLLGESVRSIAATAM